jgi:hypothetical protein
LRAHYLAQVVCDHERKMDNPICACSRIHLGWHLSVGNAVDAWIDHVLGCMTEPVCPAGECDGTGAIWGDKCTCGTGPSGYHGAHEPGCGSEPCPAGCWQSSREVCIPAGEDDATDTEESDLELLYGHPMTPDLPF